MSNGDYRRQTWARGRWESNTTPRWWICRGKRVAAGVGERADLSSRPDLSDGLLAGDRHHDVPVAEINLRLRPKILDMKPGTRDVLEHVHDGRWEPDETQTVGGGCSTWCTALFWLVSAKIEGTWRMPTASSR